MYVLQIKRPEETKWKPEEITSVALVDKEYAKKEMLIYTSHDRRMIRVSNYPIDGKYQILEILEFRKATEDPPF